MSFFNSLDTLLNHVSSMEVVSLLRAIWAAITLPILAASIPSPKLHTLRNLFLLTSGRGKTIDSSARKLSVPQKYFCHFYIVGVIWTTFLLAATWVYAYKTAAVVSESFLYSSIASHLTGVSNEFSLHNSRSSMREYKYGIWTSVFLLILMEAQVLRRLIKSIYVFKYSPSGRLHVVSYLTGIFYYTAAPLSLCSTYSMEVFKNVVCLLAEFVITGKDKMQVPEFDLWGPGVGFINVVAMQFLENGHKANDYSIPEGDWFYYVSSPHYLAEIVIYGGLVIASGFSDVTLRLLFGFVVANLAFAAGETHRWYLHKFNNYPRYRRAIIPFMY